MSSFDDYRDKYQHVKMERDSQGVLEVTLHSDGDSLRWGHVPQHEFPSAFRDIGSDRGNKVVILAGTGREFIGPRADEVDMAVIAAQGGTPENASFYEREGFYGREMINAILDIAVPVISAANGPVLRHCELVLLSDYIVASTTVSFEDSAHFHLQSLVPGDGIQIVATMLLGINRARSFMLSGDSIGAEEAHRLGLVAELHPPAEVLPRARALAAQFAAKPEAALRYTRAVLVQPIKKQMLENLAAGIAFEGLAALAAHEDKSDEAPLAARTAPAGAEAAHE